MRLNQVTVSMPDLDEGWHFYRTLGLKPIVDNRPKYARFLCPAGDSTFSIAKGQGGGGTHVYFECDDVDQTVRDLRIAGIDGISDPEDKTWLWREAELRDPGGNSIVLYQPGQNRIDPPWRLAEGHEE